MFKDQDLKVRLVAALRSGKYPKSTEFLRVLWEQEEEDGTVTRKRGYCCIGVLCDISGEGRWLRNEREGIAHFLAHDPLLVENLAGDSALISGTLTKHWFNDDRKLAEARYAAGRALAERLDIDWPCGTSNPAQMLAELNDAGAPFADLADLIEAHY